MDTTDKQIESTVSRGVAQVLPSKEGLMKLMKEKKIRLYQGFDPSAPSLHLGNFVGLMKLRQFQKLGHEIIFLVGDFTGMIGDPTDKLATRKKLTREQVLSNAKAWKEQASRVIDFDGPNAAKFMYNSEWSDKVTFKDLIEITSNVTVQQMIERDMFQARIKDQKPIYLHEFLYPVAQGYDCVAMDVDLEIGGKDQLFNMLVGRTLMKAMKGKEKFVLGTKLLVDKDGNKAGKTTGNALFLDSTPENFFAGVMSFPDDLIYLGFELLTEVDLAGLEDQISKDPMGMKKRLAFETVALLWGKESGADAQKSFENTFQEKGVPDKPEELQLKEERSLIDVLSHVLGSKSEAKRLLSQKAVDVNGTLVIDPKITIGDGNIMKIGKRHFLKVVISK
jgi:tyrosyl-tRNA synthetase